MDDNQANSDLELILNKFKSLENIISKQNETIGVLQKQIEQLELDKVTKRGPSKLDKDCPF